MKVVNAIRQAMLGLVSRSSADYWRRRYRTGLDSGPGSYGELAQFKARFLNEFVSTHGVESVIEFGCGDGNQLALANYPNYMGLDVAAEAIDLCSTRFANDFNKAFLWYDPLRTVGLQRFLSADLTLSLDVIYHLLENDVYERYLEMLFACATRFVIVYSSNSSTPDVAWHVRNREFVRDVERRNTRFQLTAVIDNPHRDQTPANFYVFERVA